MSPNELNNISSSKSLDTSKKPYAGPQLVEYGSLAQITSATLNSGENDGGSGFQRYSVPGGF
jgi:hypothetical protein